MEWLLPCGLPVVTDVFMIYSLLRVWASLKLPDTVVSVALSISRSCKVEVAGQVRASAQCQSRVCLVIAAMVKNVC